MSLLYGEIVIDKISIVISFRKETCELNFIYFSFFTYLGPTALITT